MSSPDGSTVTFRRVGANLAQRTIERFAGRLIAAGVPVVCTRYEGVTHGFVSFADGLDKGKEGQRQAADALKAAFAR